MNSTTPKRGDTKTKIKFEHIFGLYRRPETVHVNINARADYAYTYIPTDEVNKNTLATTYRGLPCTIYRYKHARNNRSDYNNRCI